MAPKGKRKATTSVSPAKTPRPKKRINLNGTASTPSRSTRSQKAALVKQQEEEKAANISDSPTVNGTAHQQPTSKPPSLASRFSISSFLSNTPSLSSASVDGTASSAGVLTRMKSFWNRKTSNMNGKPESGEKGKQRQVDEEDHLSAQESARMIELLDTPVSIKAQHQADRTHENEVAKVDDGHSIDGEKTLPGDQDQLEEQASGSKDDVKGPVDSDYTISATLPPSGEGQKETNRTKDAGEESDALNLSSESLDLVDRVSSPLEENGILRGESFDQTAASRSVNDDDDDEIFTPERTLAYEGGALELTEDKQSEEEDAKTLDEASERSPEGKLASEVQEEEQLLEPHDEEDLDEDDGRHGEAVIEVETDNAVPDNKSEISDVNDVRSVHEEDSTSANGLAEEVTEQVGQLTVDEDAEPIELSYENEVSKEAEEVGLAESGSDEDEEEILIPKRGMIDLTDSASPEPEVEQVKYALPRSKPSGFFANGILAREKERKEQGDSYSAARVIQQLGKRQVSTPSISSKMSHRTLSGFRKKDPIFSQARKSKARSIAHSKIDDILTSLKRYVKKTMHTPFIDDMLKKRVALAKVLEDDTPEHEIQTRYLREILRRSTYSMRLPRRVLKEQERLDHEAKLLRKRALGILGRQPLASSLEPDQEDLVSQTMQKQGKIAQMPGAGVDARDIVRLKPSQWLNDEVINFYMKLILKRSDEAAQKRASAREAKKRLAAASYTDEKDRIKDIASVRDVKRIWNGISNVWTFNSFFWVKLTNEGYSGIRQWTRKVDIFTKDMILLPINMGQMHWVCAAINMRKCRFEYYDSLHGTNRKAFAILRNYLASEYADKKKGSAGPLRLSGWKNYFSRQSPSQANGFDCGVFSCMTLEQLSRRSPADGEPEELNVGAIVKRSNELAEARGKGDGSDDSGSQSDDDDDEDDGNWDQVDYGDAEEEEWNFSQANMPYLRRRMVYEIAKTRLLDE